MKFDEIPSARRIPKALKANDAKVKRQDRWD